MRYFTIIILFIWSSATSANEQDVLVIQSYHQGYTWTDQFQSGLDPVLKANNIPNRVVYLDTKRHQSADYLEKLYQLYQTKFQDESYQAIVVNDNHALELVNSLSQHIGDTPVIFSGINGYRSQMHDRLNATGVIANIEMEGNLRLIKTLQPDASHIYVITGHSITDTKVRTSIERYLEKDASFDIIIRQVTPNNYQELHEFVSTVQKDSAILYWSFSQNQEQLSVGKNTLEQIDDMASVPVYIFHDSVFGYGAVGGVVHSGVSQGRSTGKLVVDVLNRSSVGLPAVQMASPETLLDFQVLKRWGLNTSIEAKYINQPDDNNKKAIMIVTLFMLMSTVIVTLLYYVRRISRSEEKASRSQILLESVLDQSHLFMAILDQYGRVVTSNNKLHELLFDQNLDIDKPIWHFKGWEKSGAVAFRHFFESESPNETVRFELEVVCRKTGSILLDVVISKLPDEIDTESQYLMEANDITLGKLAQEKLIQRESTMRNYYEQQPVMMVTLDNNNRIQAINQFAIDLLGYEETKVLGHKLSDFYEDENALPVRYLLSSPDTALNGIWRREIRYRHSTGSSLWIRENIRPLDSTGQLLIVGEDITEIRLLNEQLEYQARYDLLTETFNRNHFEIELEKAIEEVSNNLRTHAMLYLDLDQLKVLNDTAGHEAGDAAIKFAAMLVESVLPYNSILSRMGGDEFAILLKDCTENDAIKITKSIVNALGENTFNWDNMSICITCSVGVRLIDHTAESTQMVHAQADTACHAAKDEGRNRYHLYHRDDEELRRRHLEMESVNLVHEALANNRLELFAQRILGLSDSEDINQMYFEILVRIRKNDGSYISPGIFMPASEKYNVAHLIDKAVVTKTLAWLEANIDEYENLAFCSINLSGQSIGNREFVEFLLDSIEHSSVPSHKLCLEITETAAMGNMNLAIELFSKIKQLGCLIALDDFGSGLSSFGYLKKLPVDIVKIDGLFVQDMDKNETDYIMVRSINDLAKQMGKRTVAEFVENTDIIDRLMELGVDYAQGYVISRPKPLGELVNELMLEKQNIISE